MQIMKILVHLRYGLSGKLTFELLASVMVYTGRAWQVIDVLQMC